MNNSEEIAMGYFRLWIALERLARNLGIAGALCASFEAGYQQCEGHIRGCDGWEPNVKGAAF